MKEGIFEIREATSVDIPIILQLIRDLATYERAPDDVVATEEGLRDVLFGREPSAKVVIAFENTTPVGFAVYFFNFSTASTFKLLPRLPVHAPLLRRQ